MQTFKMLGTGLLCLACLNTSAHAEPALGTVAIYSDGDVEKLVAYDGTYPIWEDVRKRRFTQASTPLIPALEYKNLLYPARDYQVSVISGDPKGLHQAPVGTIKRFKLRRQYEGGSSKTREWVCEVLPGTKLKLRKQRYAVERFHCQRFTPHKKMSYPVLRETRVISWSPELGMTMQLDRETRSSKTTRRLEYLLTPGQANSRSIARRHRKVIQRNN